MSHPRPRPVVAGGVAVATVLLLVLLHFRFRAPRRDAENRKPEPTILARDPDRPGCSVTLRAPLEPPPPDSVPFWKSPPAVFGMPVSPALGEAIRAAHEEEQRGRL